MWGVRKKGAGVALGFSVSAIKLGRLAILLFTILVILTVFLDVITSPNPSSLAQFHKSQKTQLTILTVPCIHTAAVVWILTIPLQKPVCRRFILPVMLQGDGGTFQWQDQVKRSYRDFPIIKLTTESLQSRQCGASLRTDTQMNGIELKCQN